MNLKAKSDSIQTQNGLMEHKSGLSLPDFMAPLFSAVSSSAHMLADLTNSSSISYGLSSLAG